MTSRTTPKYHTTTRILKFATLISALLYSSPVLAQITQAHGIKDYFEVNFTISDGKDGRPWRQWKQKIKDSKVEEVSVTLHREKGASNTYVNLRYEGGQTFENGKRVFLTNDEERTVKWRVNGERPNDKPLMLNAYNGEVYIKSVYIRYNSPKLPFTSSSRPTPPTIKPRTPHTPPNITSTPEGTTSESDMLARCRQTRIKRPRIDPSKARSKGGLFSGKYKLEGSIFGMCIQEAGYFEDGRLKEEIPFPLDARFLRNNFEVKVRSGKNGEIRVYTTDGQDDVISVDTEIQRQSS